MTVKQKHSITEKFNNKNMNIEAEDHIVKEPRG